MPIDFSNNVPFKLTPQDMGGFDFIGALSRGQQLGQAQQLFPQQLQEAKLANVIKQVQAQYAPITVPAEAASKLAYANLMGPQFLAKLVGTPGFLANLPEETRKRIAPFLAGVATSPTSGYFMNQPSPSLNNDANQYNRITLPDIGANGVSATPTQAAALTNQTPGSAITMDAAGNPVTIPAEPQDNKNWFERTGEAKGIEKEGEEAGTIRAKAMGELGDQYSDALDRKYVFNDLSHTITSPVFQNMRSQIPLFQNKQLSWLSKTGTPEQQETIGNFIRSAKETVKDSFNSFRGQKMKGELTIAQSAAITDNDTFNVAVGKLEAGQLYNDLAMKRTQIAHDLMQTKHMDKYQALNQADKEINGDAIRQQIYAKLHPKSNAIINQMNKNTQDYSKLSDDDLRKIANGQ